MALDHVPYAVQRGSKAASKAAVFWQPLSQDVALCWNVRPSTLHATRPPDVSVVVALNGPGGEAAIIIIVGQSGRPHVRRDLLQSTIEQRLMHAFPTATYEPHKGSSALDVKYSRSPHV
jgi:hypothetical protein